ncbi:GNAT family N-acetyltransferase [Aeromicrobium alkaliterrae]|uniref:GNAT family N-acetyltransferase n=1 Tax=Aeromicrobium alkaliterrae TaxID=302168 RepID=A0ABN2JLX5_9ACTN
MLGTRTEVRPLTPFDLPEFRRVIEADPHVNVFLRHRGDLTRLEPRWLGGQVLGFFVDGRLRSVCHCGANVVPGEADDAAIDAFAEIIGTSPVRPASIAGPRDAVLRLWAGLEPAWGPARSVRPDQPFLLIDHAPVIAPDLRVRRVMVDELDLLYPACVQMFTEEVGVDPEATHGNLYRARVAQLIAQGWSYAIVERDRVLFKAEVGATGPGTCQLQGVWVDPELRGTGLAAPAVAGVVNLVRDEIAPTVSLYVNRHNERAHRTYLRAGFRQHDTFATILL